jgi:hypothetical protein
MADGFDVVPVGVVDVGSVVVGVIPAQAGRAVVCPACLDGRYVAGIDLRPTLCTQSYVKPAQ